MNRTRAALFGALFALAGLQLSGRGASAGEPLFVDATSGAGTGAVHQAAVEYLVTGQAWGDYDRDGWLDLYLTDTSGPNSLYRNNGDGTFSVSPIAPQVALEGSESGGAVFADYDNDGWPDLYVLNRGANTLFRNDSGGGFTDVTATAGVGDPGEGESATWSDYDGDGWLDLYVVNWHYYADESSPLNRDGLYHNNGDGSFTDVTGALDDARTRGPGYAATWVDYDNDGDQDLYVVNDKHFGNLLWRNDGSGCGQWCFTDVSVESGAHRPVKGMGIASGDYDSDGDLDFYFSSAGEMVLLQNQASQGNLVFLDVTDPAGVNVNAIGWGTAFFDYDRDGWLDLYLATMSGPNRLFHNLGDGTFEDVSNGSGADDPGPTIGVAAGDYENDGWPDLVIGNYDDGYRLFRNRGVAGAGNHWLTLRLEGRGPVNRDAIGARVYLTTTGGRTLMQEVSSDSSLGAGHDLALHFGLGGAVVESMTVVWPDGTVSGFGSVPIDRVWRLVYGTIFDDGFESGDASAWTVVP